MRICLAVVCVLVLLMFGGGCVLRWNGQEKVGWDPDVDLWLHHPATNGISGSAP